MPAACAKDGDCAIYCVQVALPFIPRNLQRGCGRLLPRLPLLVCDRFRGCGRVWAQVQLRRAGIGAVAGRVGRPPRRLAETYRRQAPPPSPARPALRRAMVVFGLGGLGSARPSGFQTRRLRLGRRARWQPQAGAPAMSLQSQAARALAFCSDALLQSQGLRKPLASTVTAPAARGPPAAREGGARAASIWCRNYGFRCRSIPSRQSLDWLYASAASIWIWGTGGWT